MKTETTGHHEPARLWLVTAAFAAVYLIWGSTYLGIRYAVESIPPFVMAGTRNLFAGLLLFGFVLARGTAMPSLVQWRDALISGFLMLAIGNGGVTWAEKFIPSGMAALLVALTPLWMVLFDWLRPNGVRPGLLIIAGLTVGFVGVALLARGGNGHAPSSMYGWGVAMLLTSSIAWSFGSIFSRRANKPSSPLLGISMQLICGGTILLSVAAAAGEPAQFSFSTVTTLSFGAWLYLLCAGSLIGYTAYVWLLHVSTPARVATYAYVNPLIAVLLGCTLGGEAFSRELIIAGTLIIVAVALIVTGSPRTPAKVSAEK